MTYDDYTREWLKHCQECGKLQWLNDGSTICDDCIPARDPVTEAIDAQDRFYRENPREEGEPAMGFDERYELMLRDEESK